MRWGPCNVNGVADNRFCASDSVNTAIQIGDVHGDVTIGPGTEIPRQTPPPRAVFVDREAIRDRLLDLIADEHGPPSIVVLQGLPGVGKRATARWLVHQTRDRFPGGDLHVECRHSTSDAVDVSGMVAECLAGLGIGQERMPATLAERTRLLRTRTAERPVLMVLENATEPAQVRALIPKAPGSLVLVTKIGRAHV